jgi:hypothetical protein
MTTEETEKAVLAAIRRHWTVHALQRFRKRYNLADYEPKSLINLVDRIEAKYAVAFQNPYWDEHSLVIVVAKLLLRNLGVSPKIRLLYNRRKKVIITVLPLKPDPKRPPKLKTLTV